LTHVTAAAKAVRVAGGLLPEGRAGEFVRKDGAEGATAPGISQASRTARAWQSGKRSPGLTRAGRRRGKALRR